MGLLRLLSLTLEKHCLTPFGQIWSTTGIQLVRNPALG